MYYDQLGFIPGMQGWSNFEKSINVTNQISSLKEEKAYDYII